MKCYKICNILYVVISEKDLKKIFKTESNYLKAMNYIYNEAIKRSCEKIKILKSDEKELS